MDSTVQKPSLSIVDVVVENMGKGNMEAAEKE